MKSVRMNRASKQREKRPKGWRPAAGVRKGTASPPLLQPTEIRCCLEKACPSFSFSSTSSSYSTSCYPFCASRGFKMQESTVLKKSLPSSGQLSTGSLWLDCLRTAVDALGGCRPRWLTAVLGTALTVTWPDGACEKKKQGEGGGGVPSVSNQCWASSRGLIYFSSINNLPRVETHACYLTIQLLSWLLERRTPGELMRM